MLLDFTYNFYFVSFSRFCIELFCILYLSCVVARNDHMLDFPFYRCIFRSSEERKKKKIYRNAKLFGKRSDCRWCLMKSFIHSIEHRMLQITLFKVISLFYVRRLSFINTLKQLCWWYFAHIFVRLFSFFFFSLLLLLHYFRYIFKTIQKVCLMYIHFDKSKAVKK